MNARHAPGDPCAQVLAPGANHPRARVKWLCKPPLICRTAPGRHGGPRHSGRSERAGPGRRPRPTSTALTRKRPTAQHGHKPTSIRPTRAMKALAHSSACGLGAGICKAEPASDPRFTEESWNGALNNSTGCKLKLAGTFNAGTERPCQGKNPFKKFTRTFNKYCVICSCLCIPDWG